MPAEVAGGTRPPMHVLERRLPAEDTLYPSRWRVAWCWLTFRHGGHVGQDRHGIYWQCVNCTHRMHAA